MHVLTIVGARPQFIKAAPLSAALRQQHTEFLVHTGQHYDEGMSEVFFRELAIPTPDVNLGVGSGSHAAQTGQMLAAIETLILEQKPTWVLVYGDTNSTLAGALAAAKIHVPIAHVEAGLRSYNRTMPEEINRVLTDHVSTLLLCPTSLAVDNLAREGITKGVFETGDIMIDALYRHRALAQQQSTLLTRLGIAGDYVVATIHRPANTDNPEALGEIVSALNALTVPVLFPIHPRTRAALKTHGLAPASHVHCLDPLGALDMIAVLEKARVLITDSGGLQKEAYGLRIPCVTVRTETEWRETVETGWNRLVASDCISIMAGVADAMQPVPPEHPPVYGNGQTAARIVELLEAHAR